MFFRCLFSLAIFLVIFLPDISIARPTLPSLGACDLNAPTDLDVSEQGNLLYVADTENHRISVLGSGFDCDDFIAGSEGTGPGELDSPSGVVIDSEGRIIVADTGNDRILRFDSIDGLDPDVPIGFLDELTAPITLSEPRGLGIDTSDRVYIADTGNGRVLRVDAGGGASTQIGTEDDGDDEIVAGEMVDPIDVDVCPAESPNPFAGHVYVADRELDMIHIFDDEGNFVQRFGGPGDDLGQMDTPSSIALDFQCNVYVADRGNDRVQMFGATGDVLENLGTASGPEGVTVSSFAGQGGVTGGVYVARTPSDAITRFDYINYDTDGNGLIDNDGDGLPDIWEENGIDLDFNGTVELDLDGANPDRKTLYVEIDFTGGLIAADAEQTPDPTDTAFDLVRTSFANAPVDNPDGSTGIDLIVELDDDLDIDGVQIIFGTEGVDFENDFPDLDYVFENIKRGAFGTESQRNAANAASVLQAKRLAYRYGLVVQSLCGTGDFDNVGTPICTSTSAFGGLAEITGDDFTMVHNNASSEKKQAAIFMHEFGHTLGLLHGGTNNENCKPNYVSVMNYMFTPWIPNANPALPYQGRLDYSSRALAPLDEADLDENAGIGLDPVGPDGTLSDFTMFRNNQGIGTLVRGDLPINWNGVDGLESGVVRDLTRFPIVGCEPDGMSELESFDDWSNLDYGFRNVANFTVLGHANVTEEELSAEDYDRIAEIWENFQSSRFTYSVKFICVPEVGPEDNALSPGRYRTVVNVHNPHNEEVTFKKKAVISRVEGDARGPISDIDDDVLGPHEAMSIICPTIAARFPEAQAIGDGFVILQSDKLLDVAAVYTSRDSVDVEYIAPLDANAEEPKDDPGEDPRRADLTISLPAQTRVDCPTGQGSCQHFVEVHTENMSTVDVAGPIDVTVQTDNGLSAGFILPGLIGGATDVSLIILGPGNNCYNPDCTVSATVDPTDNIPETNETNNMAVREDLG